MALANTALTAGTALHTDLVSSAETSLGMDLGGTLLAKVRGHLVARPTVTGFSRLATGIIITPNTVDVGDIDVLEEDELAWWGWRTIPTHGQRHLVATTPTLEFDEFRWVQRWPGSRRIRNQHDTAMFVAECTSQNWEIGGLFELWFDVS